MERLKVEYVPVRDLKEYKNNAKIHTPEQVEQIKESIKEFGFNDPLALWKDNEIIEGHGRLLAARELGMKEVPVIRLDSLTDEQRRAYMLVHNKLTMNTDFDFDMLQAELDEISGIDMSLFDFTMPEEPEITEEPEPKPAIEEDEYDETPREQRVKPGDIWKLGNHTLICGDSTDTTTYEKLLGDKLVDLVFTDPPYGMKKESEGVLNDNLNENDLLDFNRQWIPLSLASLKDTGCWYCWGIDEPLMDIYHEILKPLKKANKIVIRNYITWAKHSAFGINSDLQLSYPKETEKCWFIMKGMDWNNNNAEFFNTKFTRILEYMQGEAKKCGLTGKDIPKACNGVQMYSHWFTKSQFAIPNEQHYKELQDYFKGYFLLPYKELRALIGESNNPTAELKPYFDAKKFDDVGDIGLTDVWRIPTTSNSEREDTGGHATPKPIALCARAIHASTREGESVLDCFGGSGSTMIACEQLGRKCYMVELDPGYCDVILSRWEKYTGQKAELVNG